MQETDRAVGTQNPSLAVGLADINFFSSNIPFINVFKQIGSLVGDDGAWLFDIPDGNGGTRRLDYSELFREGFLDENGYVLTIPEGGITRISLFNDLPAEAGIGGRYVFRFEGEGQFSLFGGTIVESSEGRIVIDIPDGATVGITILDVEEGNHLRDFELFREEHEAIYDAGAIFNPAYIAEIEDFRVLRFLDWMGTTNSNIRNFSDLASVDNAFYGIPGNQALEYEIAGQLPDFIDSAELASLPRGFIQPVYVDPITREPLRDPVTNELILYPPDTGAFPDGIPVGAPPEILIALANQVGADPWFNIPHLATDEFVREFAEFIRDNLDPDLNIYVEYSNEVWNSGFDQWHYARQEGLDFFEERRQAGDNFGDQFGDFPSNAFYGYRSAEILSIFHEVFAEDAGRINGVLSTQTVNNFVTLEAISGAEYFFELNDPDGRVDDLFDSVGVTGYFGVAVTTDGPVADSFRTLIERSQQAFADGQTSSVYELFNNELNEYYRDRTLFEGADPILSEVPNLSLADLQDFFTRQLSVINGNDFFGNPTRTAYDLDLVQYEGGPNIVPVTNDPELRDFLRQYNRSAELAQVQEEALALFRNVGGTLANDFHVVEVQSFSSTFGSVAFLGDTNPLADAFVEYNETAAQTFGSLDPSRSAQTFQQGVTEFGSLGNDFIFGTREEDFLAGDAGNDTIDGGFGNNGLNGEDGNDVLLAEDGDDTIVGGAGSDVVRSRAGADSISGGDGNDTLFAGDGSDTVDGGSGNDLIISQLGNDFLMGGTGGDFISSSDGNDTVFGGDDRDTIQGGDGNDSLFGEQGSDSITGAFGQDTISGGLGNDTLNGNDGADTLLGEAGNDSIIGHAGADYVEGGSGADYINGLSNNDTLLGGDGRDTIFGDSGFDLIFGGEADDIINSGPGNDTVDGGSGNDNILSDRGNDVINGGTGNDRLISGDGNDSLEGNEGADLLRGGTGNDTVVGNENADILFGGTGRDIVSGGNGDDVLDGSGGIDILLGGNGNDTLIGGFNADIFRFGNNFGNDVISDFEANNVAERINLVTVTNITSFADLTANHLSSNSQGDAVITDGANTITLNGVSVSDLNSDDFIF